MIFNFRKRKYGILTLPIEICSPLDKSELGACKWFDIDIDKDYKKAVLKFSELISSTTIHINTRVEFKYDNHILLFYDINSKSLHISDLFIYFCGPFDRVNDGNRLFVSEAYYKFLGVKINPDRVYNIPSGYRGQ